MLTAALMCSVCIALGEAAPGQQTQYKKFHKDLISDLVDGKLDAVLKRLNADLAKRPDDLETLFCLAVANAQEGGLDTALEFATKAVEAGLPFERFLAGPRDLLKPLVEADAFRTLAERHGVQLVHGPMLGGVSDSSARFWVRTASEAVIQVLVDESSEFVAPTESIAVRSRETNDFATVVPVYGLKPSTEYHYRVLVDGEPQPGLRSFRTFPRGGESAVFRLAFGGGSGYTPWKEHMWETIASRDPAALLMLGDNVYIDNPTRPAVQQYCYYRRQSRSEWRALTSRTPVFSIWDDHDFVTNDQRGGPEIDEPAWKIPVWRLFKQNWANPGYGGGLEQPGCWYDFMIGDVHFVMLDGRYYREDPKGERPSMLGPVQKQWLLDTLKASTGTFKVIASPVPFSEGTKPGSKDTWDGYAAERDDIRSFLDDNRLDGVLFICADRHRSDARKTERPNGYPLYEFESSRLTNVHKHGLAGDYLFGYNEKCSFGMLRFDTTKPDPEVTYQIVNIDNEDVWSMTLKRSELSYGR